MNDMSEKARVLIGKHEKIINGLLKRNIGCIELEDNGDIDPSVKNHADMSAFKLSDGSILLDRRQKKAGDILLKSGVNVRYTDKEIKGSYPFDVKLNAARAGEYIICNKKYISPEITWENGNIVNVKQGYAKCSVCVVSDVALITDDVGIYRKCKDFFDVLLIEKGDIVLPGKEYGFIGGASGRIGDRLYFFGNPDYHRDAEKIKDFLKKNHVCCECLFDGQLTDIGGIIEI